jgi:hypothetical protein
MIKDLKNINELDDEKVLTGIAYKILDSLLHERTHYTLLDETEKEERWNRIADRFCHGNRKRTESKWTEHDADFYDKKSDLRRKAVEYIVDKNISLGGLMRHFVSEGKVRKDEYYCPGPEELSKVLHMTVRRMMDEKKAYEIKREEAEKERAMKQLLPFQQYGHDNFNGNQGKTGWFNWFIGPQ